MATNGMTRIRYVEPARIIRYIKKILLFIICDTPYGYFSSSIGKRTAPAIAEAIAATVMVIPLEMDERNGI